MSQPEERTKRLPHLVAVAAAAEKLFNPLLMSDDGPNSGIISSSSSRVDPRGTHRFCCNSPKFVRHKEKEQTLIFCFYERAKYMCAPHKRLNDQVSVLNNIKIEAIKQSVFSEVCLTVLGEDFLSFRSQDQSSKTLQANKALSLEASRFS